MIFFEGCHFAKQYYVLFFHGYVVWQKWNFITSNHMFSCSINEHAWLLFITSYVRNYISVYIHIYLLLESQSWYLMWKYLLWRTTGVARVAVRLSRIAIGRLGLVYAHLPHTSKCDSSLSIRYVLHKTQLSLYHNKNVEVVTSFLTIIFWLSTAAKNSNWTCYWLCSCYMGNSILFEAIEHNDWTI